MLKLYYRLYQFAFRIIVALIPYHFPQVIAKENATLEVAAVVLHRLKRSRVLLVTDAQLTKLNLYGPMLEHLRAEGVQVTVFDKTHVNPTIENIEEALTIYHQNKCQAIIAFGGGSPIDCAKGVAARVARPRKSLRQMKGVLGVLRKIPPVIAVPTTSGTGSETTLAAVITNHHTHEKYAISDPALFPLYAILDPLLTKSTPAHITATTGMDAMTHAIEAFIGQSNTKETRSLAIKAVQTIFEHLPRVHRDPSDLQSRAHMQHAAFWAGKAFTVAYVGNVHAIAHTMGGFYNTPHGLANAVLLPKVLRYYGQAVHQSLAELSDVVGLTKPHLSHAEKAQTFITAIEQLNLTLQISTRISGIQDEDIPKMARNAYAEANPLYPVPVIFTHRDFEAIIHSVRAEA
ncbi:MAG: iron-containing alcohol dehydrogenase [Eubacteriales bacterium]|nr:iron-containing alcohol dehydrogenase [Eubacteriales bacterium]